MCVYMMDSFVESIVNPLFYFNVGCDPLWWGSMLQVLCVSLDNDPSLHTHSVDGTSGGTAMEQATDVSIS